MRTKVLLCAAALAASLASSMAQNVYSLNVVGYVNVTLPSLQFSAVANPLDATMGGTVTGANQMAAIFGSTNGNIAGNSKIQQFVSALNDYSAQITYSGISKKWGSTFDMPPGAGALYYNAGATPTVVTFVGQVPQGSYNVASLGNLQFSLVGSPVPIGGDITNSTTVVGLLPAANDGVQTFNSAANDWNASSKWSAIGKKWSATASSTIGAGQGFLYYRAGAATTWVSNFTVQ